MIYSVAIVWVIAAGLFLVYRWDRLPPRAAAAVFASILAAGFAIWLFRPGPPSLERLKAKLEDGFQSEVLSAELWVPVGDSLQRKKVDLESNSELVRCIRETTFTQIKRDGPIVPYALELSLRVKWKDGTFFELGSGPYGQGLTPQKWVLRITEPGESLYSTYLSEDETLTRLFMELVKRETSVLEVACFLKKYLWVEARGGLALRGGSYCSRNTLYTGSQPPSAFMS